MIIFPNKDSERPYTKNNYTVEGKTHTKLPKDLEVIKLAFNEIDNGSFSKEELDQLLGYQIATLKPKISRLKTRIAALEEELKKKQQENPGVSVGGELAYEIDKLQRQVENLEIELEKLEEEHGC